MIQLNRESYQRLIDEDILALNKCMPEHSLERKHIVDVLNESVLRIYGNEKLTKNLKPTKDLNNPNCNDDDKYRTCFYWGKRETGCFNCVYSYKNIENENK